MRQSSTVLIDPNRFFWILCFVCLFVFELLHISTLTKLQYITRRNVLFMKKSSSELTYFTKKEKSGCSIWLKRGTEKKNLRSRRDLSQRFKLEWNRGTSDTSRRRLSALCVLTIEQRINLCLRTGFRPYYYFASLARFKLKKERLNELILKENFDLSVYRLSSFCTPTKEKMYTQLIELTLAVDPSRDSGETEISRTTLKEWSVISKLIHWQCQHYSNPII